MRIVFVLGSSSGGIGAHVRDLAAAFVRRGDDVVVAAPARTGELFDFAGTGARLRPVRIAASPRPLQDALAIRELRNVLADADVVHAHGVRAGAFTALASGRRGVPSVLTLHNAMLATGVKGRLLARLERLAVTRAHVVLGASGDLVEHARALGARDARPGPVPAPPLAPPSRPVADVRRELGVAHGGLLAVAIGRLAPQKDYPVLLAAAARWQSAAAGAPRPRLVIAGDGPLLPELQAEIDRAGLDAALLGRRSDPADLLAAADLFVLSSRWEARALVVQEALRAGVPVVATAVGGIPDLAGDAAVLVRPGDPGALAEAVSRVAADPALRSRLAAAGIQRAETWPDTEEVVALLGGLYTGLLRDAAPDR